ncbi:TonB-dependent receptor domain-containing protein [Vibrio olivae]
MPGEVVGNTNFSSGHAVTNAKEVLDVQKSEQYEVGAKYETGEYGATLTLFQISKPSYMYIDNGDGTDTYGDNGEQRHRGLELTAFGQPIDNVTVVGGVTLIDSEMVKSTSSAER